jgi:hypothetical protein
MGVSAGMFAVISVNIAQVEVIELAIQFAQLFGKKIVWVVFTVKIVINPDDPAGIQFLHRNQNFS